MCVQYDQNAYNTNNDAQKTAEAKAEGEMWGKREKKLRREIQFLTLLVPFCSVFFLSCHLNLYIFMYRLLDRIELLLYT